MQRQRVLERAGWVFWRCFASAFIRRRKDMLDDLVKTLTERGIEPIGAEGAPRSVHTERRIVPSGSEATHEGNTMPIEVSASDQASAPAALPALLESATVDEDSTESPLYSSTDAGELSDRVRRQSGSVRMRDASLPFSDYEEYAGPVGSDPRSVSTNAISEGIIRIVEVEGPVVAKRAYDIYLRSCGIRRMGFELKSTMNEALAEAISQAHLVSENEGTERDLLFAVVRVNGSRPIKLRTRGPRSFEEIPPSELQVVARYLLRRNGHVSGSDEHLRAVLECFDLKRLTTQVGTTLLEVLERNFPYVNEYLSCIQE